ncbi:MAG: cytochrome C [Chitinophagaceae bacterium]|nr:cytochrome C [Chitinophagaceae bacterium]
MKRFKKILKWTGITLVVIIAGVSIIAATRQNTKYEAPYPDIKASTDTAIIAKGRHLVLNVAHCVGCHSPANVDSIDFNKEDLPLTGGRLFDLPVGKIYSRNITPDKETGIGRYTDAEIARALYYGVHPDGTVVYDFMPFHNISKEDMTAIISYLRVQKPVKNKVPENTLNLVGNLVKAYMIKPVGPNGEIPAAVKKDTTAVYGKYLAMSVAECNGCHTERNLAGEFTGEPFGGGAPMDENNGFPALTPPNLTPDPTGRIYGWTQEMFINRFRQGKLIPYSPMHWSSFKHMTDDELKAIYNFLHTLKPVKTKERK